MQGTAFDTQGNETYWSASQQVKKDSKKEKKKEQEEKEQAVESALQANQYAAKTEDEQLQREIKQLLKSLR
jgi:hypothetical protein